MHKRFFVTGTDTGAGKTVVAAGLLAAAHRRGYKTAALKPVAAGAHMTPEGLRNDDALWLQEAMSERLPYEQINPVLLEPAIAPHIAAARARQKLSAAKLAGFCRGAFGSSAAEFTLVEGAGGWRVPLNSRERLSDLAVELQLPVLLVVGMKLGCLNHALLTAEAIAADGLSLAGWVANCLTPEMAALRENIETLQVLLDAPCLGVVPELTEPLPERVADSLDVEPLISST